MTREEAIHILIDLINSDDDSEEAVQMAIKALEQEPTIIHEIPKDYKYDTETEDFIVYRHKYTGDEIHIERPIPLYRVEQEPCEDCISRQDVKELYYIDGYIDFRKICELPPVTPVSNISIQITEREKYGRFN